LALFAIGLAVIWAPGRPAMGDVPQHAAQVAMLRDLLQGRSAWTADLKINLFTPYIVGYVLALPLAFVIPPMAALKVVLTVAYAAFGLIARAVGRALGAPSRLDAYYFLSFFGIAWSYGLYPYLVAAPIALAFIWAALTYARLGGWRRGALLAAIGVVLVLSHVFAYAFAAAAGGLILARRIRNPGGLVRAAWPFIPSVAAFAALTLLVQHAKSAAFGYTGFAWDMGAVIVRPFFLVAGAFDAWAAPWAWAVGLLLLGLPLLAGLRPARRRPDAWIIMAALAALMLLAPFTVMAICVYPRFAPFVLPAFVWLLEDSPRLSPRRFGGPQLVLLTGLLGAFALVQHVLEELAFAREARDFDRVLARAEPRQRALSLVVDSQSAVNVNPLAYLNFPQWYAVDKGGLVDIGFIKDPQMIVRLAHPGAPPYDDRVFLITGAPARLDPGMWTYVFVRGRPPAALFAGCAAQVVAQAGTWTLLQPRACRP
jgi:hypothetical protein